MLPVTSFQLGRAVLGTSAREPIFAYLDGLQDGSTLVGFRIRQLLTKTLLFSLT